MRGRQKGAIVFCESNLFCFWVVLYLFVFNCISVKRVQAKAKGKGGCTGY